MSELFFSARSIVFVVHPSSGVLVASYFPHSCSLSLDRFINFDLLRVEFVDYLELVDALDPGQHHVDHASSKAAHGVHHQLGWLGNGLALKLLNVNTSSE